MMRKQRRQVHDASTTPSAHNGCMRWPAPFPYPPALHPARTGRIPHCSLPPGLPIRLQMVRYQRGIGR